MSSSTTKTNKSQLVVILGLLVFLANGDNYAASPLLPRIAADLGLSISNAGYSVTAYMFCFGLFTILFGPLSDKFGKGRIVKIAAFGASAFSILAGLSFDFPTLVVFRAMNGVLAAGIFPVTMAIIGAEFDDSARQGAMARVLGLGFLGGASATVIGGILAQIGSWRAVYIFYGVAQLILSFFILRLIPSGVVSHEPFNPIKSYSAAFRKPSLILLVSILFAVGFSVFGSFSYSGYYAQTITALPIIIIGLIVASFGIGTVTSSRLLSFIQPRLKSKTVPMAGLIGFVSLAVLVASASLKSIAIPMLVVGFFGFGLAFVIIQSTVVMHAQAQLPSMRGTVMSLVSFNMFVGGGVGTLVNGSIIAAGNARLMYGVAAVLMLAASIAVWGMIRRIARVASA